MKNLRHEMIKEMELRNFSDSTKLSYLKAMRDLLGFHNKKDPTEIDVQMIKDFLYHFRNNNIVRGRGKRSENTVNKHRAGVIFFYDNILKRHDYQREIPSLKTKKKNPVILSAEEVKQMIDSVHKVQYKAILMLLYSTGIRLAEIQKLKVTDIDSKRMVINIRQGKGGKDRQAILTPTLLKVLRTYWRLNPNKHSSWLFTPTKNPATPGHFDKPMSATAYDYILKTAAKAAGVKKKFILTA